MSAPERPTVTVLVSRELLAELGEWSAPVQVKIIETPGVGTGWELVARTHEGLAQPGDES